MILLFLSLLFLFKLNFPFPFLFRSKFFSLLNIICFTFLDFFNLSIFVFFWLTIIFWLILIVSVMVFAFVMVWIRISPWVSLTITIIIWSVVLATSFSISTFLRDNYIQFASQLTFHNTNLFCLIFNIRIVYNSSSLFLVNFILFR